ASAETACSTSRRTASRNGAQPPPPPPPVTAPGFCSGPPVPGPVPLPFLRATRSSGPKRSFKRKLRADARATLNAGPHFANTPRHATSPPVRSEGLDAVRRAGAGDPARLPRRLHRRGARDLPRTVLRAPGREDGLLPERLPPARRAALGAGRRRRPIPRPRLAAPARRRP